jgi:gag-polyprotein putative aspartyl protease
MKYLLKLFYSFAVSLFLILPTKAEEISLARTGGVYEVPVTLNGVMTLNFVLDSGAAEVSIPAEVMLTLMHTHTVSANDFLPGRTYVLADGSKVKSPRFILHSLKIGKHRIESIPASISKVGSSLLLGQNLLERLGVWSLDSRRHILILGSSVESTQVTSGRQNFCDNKADAIFYKRHPELLGRKLHKDESDLGQEWLQIRRNLGNCSPTDPAITTQDIDQSAKLSCDDKADAIFYKRHPELSERKIRKDEIALTQEWLRIRESRIGCNE